MDEHSSTAHMEHRVRNNHILPRLQDPPVERDGLVLFSMKFKPMKVDKVRDEGEVRTVEMHPNRCGPIFRVLPQEGGDVLIEEFG